MWAACLLEVKTPIYAEPERKKIRGLLGISTDITERKLAEEALERVSNVFEESLNRSLGIEIVNFDYRLLAVNQKLCEITGYTSEELTKLSFVDITHPEEVTRTLLKRRR